MAVASEPGPFEAAFDLENETAPPKFLWITAFAVAFAVDFLFWGTAPGVSFPIWIMLLTAGQFFLGRQSEVRPHPRALWLLPLLGLFPIATLLRAEPFTVLLNWTVTFAVAVVLSQTFRGGRWTEWRMADYLVAPLHLLAGIVVRFTTAMAKARESQKGSAGWIAGRSASIVRGVLLAIPVLLVFGLLLASADPIFSETFGNLFSPLESLSVGELAFRALYVLALTGALAGAYLHTLSDKEETLGSKALSSAPRMTLGSAEALIVLGSVAALFASFVGFQFRYFFGGESNVQIHGMTYAEYARRGFGELVAVAFLSLLLYAGLTALTRRESVREKKAFSLLGAVVVVLVGVILVSAFQRLLLYEDAYGFTRARTYSHAFMVWLGAFLLLVLALELTGRVRYFATSLALSIVVFALALNILNVDGLIARHNLERAERGLELDVQYLLSLSDDAVPVLARGLPDLEGIHRLEMASGLACRLDENRSNGSSWRSFSFSRSRSAGALEKVAPELAPYRVTTDEYGSRVVVTPPIVYSCGGLQPVPLPPVRFPPPPG